ncbi:hypothetical protein [Burkholderia ubonensis]|uniref:hypothetical protein n=1 Tax=Burkholderia ubonensis TaxID=101571 RepID=UPI0015826DE8|nr:hypothetical protein [Burkholderia ubonensis]
MTWYRSILAAACGTLMFASHGAQAQGGSEVPGVILTQLTMFITSAYLKAGKIEEAPDLDVPEPATAAALQAKVFAGTAQTLRMRKKKCTNVIGARVPEDKHDTRTIAVTCSDGGRYMIVVDEATITP